jgi:type VI secretion system secreted protein Hcp
MAFDAVMFFPRDCKEGFRPKGESVLCEDGITLFDGWSFSLENKLNIGPHTGGAGLGKAEFEVFTCKKTVDTASHHLFEACGRGSHFNAVELKLFRSTGAANSTNSANLFLHWTFNMMAVEKVEWAHGEEMPEETVTFRFGACKVVYKKQDETGVLKAGGQGVWNQIANGTDFNKLIA